MVTSKLLASDAVRRDANDSAPWSPPAGDTPLREVLKEYRETYRAPRRILDWYFRALADDPLAGLAWYGAQLTHIAREPKRLPFERHAGLVGSPAASHSG